MNEIWCIEKVVCETHVGKSCVCLRVKNLSSCQKNRKKWGFVFKNFQLIKWKPTWIRSQNGSNSRERRQFQIRHWLRSRGAIWGATVAFPGNGQWASSKHLDNQPEVHSLYTLFYFQNQLQLYASSLASQEAAVMAPSVRTDTSAAIVLLCASTGWEACVKRAISANSFTNMTCPRCPSATSTLDSMLVTIRSVRSCT